MELTPRPLEDMEMKDLDQYRGQRVFVTGHTGFKGAWLWQWLHQLGAELKGYALAPQHPEDIYLTVGGDQMGHSVIADVRQEARLQQEMLDFAPDYVFHLAAQPLVRYSYAHPLETFAVNVMGTAHVLEAVRQLDKPCVVVCITTDKVYKNLEWVYPYRETDRLGGHDPYSASKAGAEVVIDSYRQSYFAPAQVGHHGKAVASTRAGNVIGGGDWSADRLVPDIMRALQHHEAVTVRNPQAVRPWQHVLEPVAGYLQLGLALRTRPEAFADAWNFGPLPEDALTVEELVRIAIRVAGRGSYTAPLLTAQPHEAHLLRLDVSKAQAELGWQPRWRAAQAVELTVRWYEQFWQGADMRAYTAEQIHHYQEAYAAPTA